MQTEIVEAQRGAAEWVLQRSSPDDSAAQSVVHRDRRYSTPTFRAPSRGAPPGASAPSVPRASPTPSSTPSPPTTENERFLDAGAIRAPHLVHEVAEKGAGRAYYVLELRIRNERTRPGRPVAVGKAFCLNGEIDEIGRAHV